MCAGETREAAFWASLHASTTATGPTFTMPSEGAAKAPLYNSAGRTATTPDESNQAQRAADMKLSSRLADTYDFLADIESGNSQTLPFLDALDPSCPPQFDYNPKQASVKRESTDDGVKQAGPQNSTPPEDESASGRQKQSQAAKTDQPASGRRKPEQPANEPEPSTGSAKGGSSLRRGLRPRSKPKQYQAYESEESDGEWSPKRKKGSRKRSRPKKEEAQTKTESAPLSSTRLSGRQERPLPPDLDEKQRKRILRNRASAERSRLKRLGQIAMLEQENRELKQQLAESQQAASGNAGAASRAQSDVLHENSMLRAELKMMKDRVQTLTCLLTTANQRAAGEMLGC